LDTGVSGAKGRDERPGYDKLMKAVACREIDMVAAYLPLPIVRAFDHRFRLGLSVAPPFGLECLTSLADSTAYYALC
jgi:hypothetical protein